MKPWDLIKLQEILSKRKPAPSGRIEEARLAEARRIVRSTGILNAPELSVSRETTPPKEFNMENVIKLWRSK